MRRMKDIMKTIALGLGVMVLGIITQSGLSYADPIGPNCGTCQGSIYTLSYSGTPLLDADPLHETFRVTLTIDTTGYTGGGVAIDAVAIKVSSSVFSSSIFAAPSGAGNWTLVPGGISSGGCSGSGSGFDCADYTGVGVGPAVGGILSWTFDQTINNGDLFTAVDSSIKARYVDANGGKVGDLVSEEIKLQQCCTTQVPEPSTLLLLGSGLAGLGLWGRRMFRS